jgi:hypothetical protein
VRPDKKEIETWQLSRFRDTVSDFPTGEVEPHERPDFLVRSSAATIGIELTQLFRPNTTGAQPLQEGERLREYVCETARRIYEEAGGTNVDVMVSFSPHLTFRSNKVRAIAEHLARTVRTLTVAERSHVRIEYDWDNRELFPDEVIGLRVANFGPDIATVWQPGEAGFVPDTSVDQLQSEIARKASLYNAYRDSCDEAWLVLVADGFSISTVFSLTAAAQNATYYGPFERVYYFDNFGRRSHRLTISSTHRASVT